MQSRFATYNYAGKPTAFYLVKGQPLSGQVTTVKRISHHIFIADRSGSMYGDIESLKAMVEKLWTLEEYRDSEMLVTLISYSSSGDMTTHFNRIRVADVMAPGNRYVEEIRRIRATCMTCISQALAEARTHIQPGELTAISLHTDGYANDRSPTTEARELERLADEYGKAGDVVLNTVAYREWSDIKLLTRLANLGSGRFVLAKTVRDVYDALKETADLLVSNVVPAVACPIGTAAYQVFISTSGQKVTGSAGDMIVRGVRAEDDQTLYTFTKVAETEYRASTASEDSMTPMYAFARVKLAEGRLNEAKYAVVGTRDRTMIGTHYRALVNMEIAAFLADLDSAIFNPEGLNSHFYGETYGLEANKVSVLALCGILAEYAGDIQVDMSDMSTRYQRRGLKKISGKRAEDGSLIPNAARSRVKDNGGYAQVLAFDLNNANATINMRVKRGIEIVDNTTGEVVSSVAGVKLDNMCSFNNYTIVGDGVLNIESMKAHIGSKKAFRALAAVEVVSGEYDPTMDYVISFTGLPLVDFNQTYSEPVGVFNKLARFKVLTSIFGAILKGKSEDLTPEQIEALAKYHLTPALYFSPPSTVPYTSQDDALAKGEIDSRVSYEITIGDKDILNLGKLHSANKCLERLFTMATADGPVEKPRFDLYWATGVKFGLKVQGSRFKETAVDRLMRPIFDDFLGLVGNGSCATILQEAGADDPFIARFDMAKSRQLLHDDTVEVFTAARRLIESAADVLYQENVRPIAFYIGTTGLLPDEFDTVAMTADQLAVKYPDIGLSKGEKENGTFFSIPADPSRIGDSIISVSMENVFFTTPLGEQAIKSLNVTDDEVA